MTQRNVSKQEVFAVLDNPDKRGLPTERRVVEGSVMQWTEDGQFQRGRIEVQTPPAAVLNCVVSYDGCALLAPIEEIPPSDGIESCSDVLRRNVARGRDQ